MKSTATNQKISWFSKEDKGATLNLSPDFQRRPVWTDEQASYLIDTVMNSLPFPEVYLRSHSKPTGETVYEAVDGQQRIRSLLQFARNELVLEGDQVSPKLSGKSFEHLTDTEKTMFWNYEVVVRDLGDASDVEIRDLFQRLNINQVTLTDQELRHAKFKGRFIKLMESLADDEWWVEMHVVSLRQVRRMDDVEFVSELFVGVMAGPQDKKNSLDDYYHDYESDMPDEAKWRERFLRTRQLISDTMTADEIHAWSGKSDFYSLFLAFGSYIEKSWAPKMKNAVVAALADFRKKVDQAKRKDNTKTFAKPINEYAEAVTRAASDVGRRVVRVNILETLIGDARKKA